jgi:hypothetical protein
VRSWIGLSLFYLIGALSFLWPIPVSIDQAVWGDRFDAWTTLWLIGHLAEGLETGGFQANTTEILFPIGYNLWSFGHMALQGMGAVLVCLGLPLIATYNLLLIGGVWTSGLAMHLLAKELTRSHLAAAVAGIVFASSPFLYAEGGAGCIELVAAGLIPLHAWSLVRLTRKPSWPRCAVATVVLALIGPFNWYYTLFAGLFGLGFCAWRVLAMGRELFSPACRRHRRGVALVMLSMAFAATLNLPLIDAARQETPARPSVPATQVGDAQAWERATAITQARTPLSELTEETLIERDSLEVHLNSTSVLALIEAKFTVNPLGVTPGLLAYGVAFIGVLVAGRRTWGWLALGASFTILSLGPFLNLDGALLLPTWATSAPLPYRWATETLPFFEKAYRPYRFAILVLQCAAIVGAIGANTLARAYPRVRAWPLVLALAVIGFGQPIWTGAASRPTIDATTPSLYDALRTAPSGAVIEVPLHYQPISIATAQQQYHQIAHGHPLLNTNQLIRRPDLLAFQDFVANNRFVDALLDLGRPQWPIEVPDSAIEALIQDGFRYIVVRDRVAGDTAHLAGEATHGDLVGTAAREMIHALLGAPAFSTEDGAVYDLTMAALESDRVRSFDGDSVTELTPLFDIVQGGFSLRLTPDQAVSLYEGSGREISFWTIDQGASALRLKVSSAEGETTHDIAMSPGFWTRTSVRLPEGIMTARLVAGKAAANVAMTRFEVRQ